MIKISCSFDDGSVFDLIIADLLKKYGFNKAVFYVPVNYEEYFAKRNAKALSFGELRELALDFEIGSHTINHPLLTRIPEEEAWEEINHSKGLLEAMVSREITKFCYPRGYYNQVLSKMVEKAGYDYARTTIVGKLLVESPFEVHTAVHVCCPRKEYKGVHWYQYALNMLNDAQELQDAEYHFWGHSWEIINSGELDLFEQFLGKLREKVRNNEAIHS